MEGRALHPARVAVLQAGQGVAVKQVWCICACGEPCRPNKSTIMLLDVVECFTDNGGCEHTCNNTLGSFTCSCRNGYELDTDDQGCHGKVMMVIMARFP